MIANYIEIKLLVIILYQNKKVADIKFLQNNIIYCNSKANVNL